MSRPLLRIGSVGPAVTLMQQALNIADSVLARLKEDGNFGPKTQSRVKEFQGQHQLAQDGVVGPMTHGEMEVFYQLIASIVAPSPGSEAAARERIVAVARSAIQTFGWPESNITTPPDHSPSIAGRFCFGPSVTPDGGKLRHGGLSLATIFQKAGHRSAPNCLIITGDAQKMYAKDPEPPNTERNRLDLESWCGIFALFCHRTAGLKLSSWPLRFVPVVKPSQAEFRTIAPSQAGPGDIGILDPTPNGQNHHFLIVEKNGTEFKSIDGNAGNMQTIVSRRYTVTDEIADERLKLFKGKANGKDVQVAIVSPLWGKVL